MMLTESQLSSFFSFLLYVRRCSPLTVKAYKTDLDIFADFMSRHSLGSVSSASPRNIRRWIVELLSQGRSPASVNRKIAALRTFFRFLCASGEIRVNPTRAIESVKVPKRLPVFLREEEMNLMLEPGDFPDDYEGHRDRAILQTFYLTGVRVSELCNLTVGQVDLSVGQLLVNGKRNKQRIIPLTSALHSILFSYLHIREEEFGKANPTDALFLNAKGEPVNSHFVYNIVHRHIAEVSSVSKKSPHVLRHTFATVLLNNGADLMAIKELLGHSSLAATQIYAHSDFEQLSKIYKLAHPRADN